MDLNRHANCRSSLEDPIVQLFWKTQRTLSYTLVFDCGNVIVEEAPRRSTINGNDDGSCMRSCTTPDFRPEIDLK